MAPMANRLKNPAEWQPDIDRSVAEYDEWYLAESPRMFAQARERAVVEVEEAMLATDDFRMFGPDALIARPGTLFVARMCVSPPMARDRFVGFSGANKSLVTAMEREGAIPARTRRLGMQLQVMCDFLRPLLDPGLFCWLENDRAPTAEERGKAHLVIGERLASAFYLPALRNVQEARQKELLRAYLEGEAFEESRNPPFEMPPGTFGFGRNVRVVREDGEPQNLPVDCVVSPLDAQLPLACVELKSAGDFTNVNKRRKEESDKHDALKRAHGDDAVFLLQLSGYFNRSYLGFEAAVGIDWAWDHRLGDLAPYFGIE
ncbi:MAG TPA: XamI family restriction endonuclease [Solirubrobacteraceae bacterium]|nr:XamI family restriction endonuclease [Solirubrobacteraceae bacterium]